jgi:hypothetical protein
MNSAALYFHYPCFDGAISAVLAWEFLEKHEHWNISNFEPVDYTVRPNWLSQNLQKPCAVVDFLYHPNADFWADHHQTTMLTKAAHEDYVFRRGTDQSQLLFDPRARSCAALIFKHFRRQFSDKPHLKEMVDWAEKIDSARYSSVKEAILGDAPALKIARTLSVEEERPAEYARFLLRQLRDHDLRRVAGLEEVKSREGRVRHNIIKGLESVKARLRLQPGDVAVFDARPKEGQVISRYAPYYFQPNARYSIAVIRYPEGVRITAMRNPWRKFRSIPLGRAFAKFGGGGHERVGAVQLSNGSRNLVRDVVKSLLSEMQHRSR